MGKFKELGYDTELQGFGGTAIYFVMCYYKDKDNNFSEIESCYRDIEDALFRAQILSRRRLTRDRLVRPKNYIKLMQTDEILKEFVLAQDKLKTLEKVEVQRHTLI